MKKDKLMIPLIFICFIILYFKIKFIISYHNLNKEFNSIIISQNSTSSTLVEIKENIQTRDSIIQMQQNVLLQQQMKILELEQIQIEQEYILANYENANSPYADIINNLTDYEMDLLCTILAAEARGESIKGQRAVVEVILNRVISNKFSDSIQGVLSAYKQFSTWDNMILGKYTKIQKEIVELVATENPVLPNLNYVYFSKGKAKYMTDPIQIGNHWFGAKANN